MKQAYERVMDWGYHLEPVELLPQCKKVTRHGMTTEYQKVRKKFLWIIPYTAWVRKDDIVLYPMERVEYYACSCGEDYE